jgi:hypothetical protein
MKHILDSVRPSFTTIYALALALAVTGGAPRGMAQEGKGESVIQKATEQFENSPLKTISLDKDIFRLRGRRDHSAGNVRKRLASPQNLSLIGLHDGPYPPQALPTVRYSSTMALSQGSQRLTLVNYEPAHTDGDTVIYINPADVTVVGDIFSNDVYPIIDLSSGGSIDGLIRSLDQILAHTDEQTKIVPGHGPLATRTDLHDYRDMLVQVRQRIEVLIEAGKTIDEAVAAAPTRDFDSKWGRGYVTPNVFTKLVFSSLTLPSSGAVIP